MTRSITVKHETETPRGWRYDIIVGAGTSGAADRALIVDLAWVDHDHWSGGVCQPSRVIEAVMRVVVDLLPGEELPDRFDASSARRWVADLDGAVRDALDIDIHE